MSGRSKRESRGSTRGKRESESRGSSGRVKRERDRERETEAPSSRGSPVRVKREVQSASAREALAPIVPSVRVKREREADEESEPEREVRGARGWAGPGRARRGAGCTLGFFFSLQPPILGGGNSHSTSFRGPARLRSKDSTSLNKNRSCDVLNNSNNSSFSFTNA